MQNNITTHEGVQCDTCHQFPLIGVRYKCGNCVDFDLCSNCEQTTSHNSNHVFLKIKTPLPDVYADLDTALIDRNLYHQPTAPPLPPPACRVGPTQPVRSCSIARNPVRSACSVSRPIAIDYIEQACKVQPPRDRPRKSCEVAGRPRRSCKTSNVNKDPSSRPSSLGYYNIPDLAREVVSEPSGPIEVTNVDLVACGKEALGFLKKVDDNKQLGEEQYLNDIVFVKYVMFLNLKTKYNGEHMLPSDEVEAVWQSHLIRPDKYQAYCVDVLKTKERAPIDHHVETMACMKEKGRSKCQQLWRREYGVEESDDGQCVEVGRARFEQELAQLNLKVKEVIQDRDWYGYFMQYMNRLKQEHFDAYLEEGKKGYYRFLELCRDHTESDHLEPTYPIDLMWHMHMMHPREYHEFCQQKLLQELLVHEPWPERFTVQQMFDNLDEIDGLWEKKFGFSMHYIRDQFC